MSPSEFLEGMLHFPQPARELAGNKDECRGRSLFVNGANAHMFWFYAAGLLELLLGEFQYIIQDFVS